MKQSAISALVLGGLVMFTLPLSASGRTEGSILKSWSYPAGTKAIVIDADRQDLIIKAGGPGVSGRLVGDHTDEVKVTKNGDTLTFTVRSNRGWFSWATRAARVELTVPADLDLDLTSAAGAIVVQVATNHLRARSASGDIEAPEGGLSADVDSTSGTVRLQGFQGTSRAASVSGDVRLDNLSGPIFASSMSGSITGRDLSPHEGSSFESVSGDVNLALVGGAETYRVRADTVSGDIRVGESTAEGRLQVGSGPSLSLRSVSGSIRVQ